MLLGRAFPARWQIDHKKRHEVAASFQMNEYAGSVHPAPMLSLDLIQVHGEIFNNRYPLASCPFEIGVPQKIRGEDLRAVSASALRLRVHSATPIAVVSRRPIDADLHQA